MQEVLHLPLLQVKWNRVAPVRPLLWRQSLLKTTGQGIHTVCTELMCNLLKEQSYLLMLPIQTHRHSMESHLNG